MPSQSDIEFLISCGLADDPEEGRLALSLRRELAAYGSVEPETLGAETRIIDTGLLHPADSIDLVEFTCIIEGMLGVRLESADLQPLVAAGAESMELRQWIRLVLEIRKRKLAAPSEPKLEPTPESKPNFPSFNRSRRLFLMVFLGTMSVLLWVGMFLPGLQRSGHPRPVLAAILSVLFFLEPPARSWWGLGDRDVAMVLVRLISNLLSGAVAGLALASLAVWIDRWRRLGQEPASLRGVYRSAYWPTCAVMAGSGLATALVALAVLELGGLEWQSLLVSLLAGLVFVLPLNAILSLWFTIEVHTDGIQGYDVWGRYCFVPWNSMQAASSKNALGLKYIKVTTSLNGFCLWLPLFLRNLPGFSAQVVALAPADNPLRLFFSTSSIPR